MDEQLAQQLGRFCLRFELAEADLGHVVRIARWLLHEAAALNLDAEHFDEDLVALWPDHEAFREVLSSHFDEAKQKLRAELLTTALLKHGAVLDNIEWRVDQVMGDTRAPRLGLSVAMVTLEYRTRRGADQLTLQMTADQLRQAGQVLAVLAQQMDRVTEAANPPRPPRGDEVEPEEG